MKTAVKEEEVGDYWRREEKRKELQMRQYTLLRVESRTQTL